jgi:ACR3 family arsenite efflux pump ArsB
VDVVVVVRTAGFVRVVVRVPVIVVVGVPMIVGMVVRVALLRRTHGDAVNRHIAGESAATILAHVTTPPDW